MFPLLFALISFKICTVGNSDIEKYIKSIEAIHIENPFEYPISTCDMVVGYFFGFEDAKEYDSILVNYVEEGGNLFLITPVLDEFADLQKVIPYTALGSTRYSDSVDVEGHGLFAGINFKVSTPSIYFNPDTEDIIDYVSVSDSGFMYNQITLYGETMGRGNLVVTSMPLNATNGNVLFGRVIDFFLPDAVVLGKDDATLYSQLVKDAIKDSLSVRYYTSDYEGMLKSKLVIATYNLDVVTSDSTSVVYMGPFVCDKLVKCKHATLYSVILAKNAFFQLDTPMSTIIDNGRDNEVVFTDTHGNDIGFVSLKDNVGVLPFEFKNIVRDDEIHFIKFLLNASISTVGETKRIAYFKEGISGELSGVSYMEVYTVDGRLLMNLNGGEKLNYNFETLPDGLYIIKLVLNSGRDSIVLFNKLQGERQ